MDTDLIVGPDATTRFASVQRQVEDTVAGWLDDDWCEGAALIDHRRRVLLYFTWHLDGPAHRAALAAVLARTWPGWDIRWAYGGLGDIVAHVDLDPAVVRVERGTDAQLFPGDPDYIGCLVTVRDTTGRVDAFALRGSLSCAWRGPDLVAALPRRARVDECLEHPESGLHIDLATRTAGFWTMGRLPSTSVELAARWPGWRVEFWADRWPEQVERCAGAVVLPRVDLRSGLDKLSLRLSRAWDGDPGTDWLNVVRALETEGHEVRVSPEVSDHVKVVPSAEELAAVARVIAELRETAAP
ncbi:MAG TPA: hypothetical protein VFV67_04855 [Actinophytocola sp.]|uniref:hypothetical protein n=1 Tax=Actinophytocola sp. TaxID=1872138 RepID=UPI002DBF7D24|nr:hypothetical protein [Actinophytocola sp.]HEU5469960.1 hypothetical protein [Actinophytocola sp.]